MGFNVRQNVWAKRRQNDRNMRREQSRVMGCSIEQ